MNLLPVTSNDTTLKSRSNSEGLNQNKPVSFNLQEVVLIFREGFIERLLTIDTPQTSKMWIIEKVAPLLLVVLFVLHQHVSISNVRATEVDHPPDSSEDNNHDKHEHGTDQSNNHNGSNDNHDEGKANTNTNRDDDEFYIDPEPKHDELKHDGSKHEEVDGRNDTHSTGEDAKHQSRQQAPSRDASSFDSFVDYHDNDGDDAEVDDLYDDLMSSSSLMTPTHRIGHSPHHYVDHVDHHSAQDYHTNTGIPEPHFEAHEDSYVDTSDPNNPKHVHVEQKSKSVVSPNGESHEHFESQTAKSLNGNSFHHHSSSSSSSYSSSVTSSSSSSSNNNGNIQHQHQYNQHISDHPTESFQSFEHPLTSLPQLRPPRPPLPPLPPRISHVLSSTHGFGSFGHDNLALDSFQDSSGTFSHISNRMKHLSKKNVLKLKRRIESAQRRLDRTPY